MLAIPLSKKMSWRNPPLVTVILILVNAFIYFAFQSGEDEKLMAASQYYFDSGLAEIEVARYAAYAGERSGEEKADLSFSSKADKRFIACYVKMRSDTEFMHLLLSGRIIKPTDRDHRAWQSMRRDYELKMDEVVSWRHGLRPAAPRATTWFSHMFLHGGIGHLVGNMIFLWLIGCMIEFGSGRLWFILLYLLGGFAAAGLFWLFNPYTQIPLVGASGAISGIMGAFCVFYGLKKVRIFLTLGFYFNYLKFPALMMLPLWVGYEVLQMLTMEGSNIAYAAHIGGLIGGAGLTFVLCKIPNAVHRDAFESEAEGDKNIKALDRALLHMRNLEFDQAREHFHQVLAAEPGNVEVMRHLFNLEKQTPQSAAFHQAAARLLQHLCRDETTHQEARAVFREYAGLAKPPRLTISLYVRLSAILASLGETKDAKTLLTWLLKKAPQEPGLPSAFLKLAGAFQKMGMSEQHTSCLRLIISRFPASPEARIAKRAM